MKQYTNYPYDFAGVMIKEVKDFFVKAPMETNIYKFPYFGFNCEQRLALSEAFSEMEWVFSLKKNSPFTDYFVSITPEQHEKIKQDYLLEPIEEDFK